MFFRQVKVGPMQNFSYIAGDEGSKEAAVFDPGWETGKLTDIARKENLEIKKIILTHSHYDHSQKADELACKTKAAIYVHELEFDEIRNTVKNRNIKIIKVKDNDMIKIGGIKIKVIHTPGHTAGAICLLFERKLVTGDTLFVGAVGRTDLKGSDAAKLFDSLQKLKKLGNDIEVYPGHDYGDIESSTIGIEMKGNPYFMCSSREQFLGLMH